MAKKSKQVPDDPSAGRAKRKQMISDDQIKKAAAMVEHACVELKALAAVMEKHDLSEVEIDGIGLLHRGVDEIDRFIENVDKSVKRARREQERLSM